MIQSIYVVEDVKAELMRTPFFADSDASATRAFAELANDDKSEVSKYPDDFRLVRLGKIDLKSGGVLEVRETLGFASQFKRPSPQLELPAVRDIREVGRG